MSADRIKEIRERVEKATAGPWVIAPAHHTSNQGIDMVSEIVREYSPDKPLVTVRATAWKPVRWADARHNARFIAHARQDIPWLLTELESAQAELARLKSQLADALKVTRKRGAWIFARTSLAFLSSPSKPLPSRWWRFCREPRSPISRPLRR